MYTWKTTQKRLYDHYWNLLVKIPTSANPSIFNFGPRYCQTCLQASHVTSACAFLVNPTDLTQIRIEGVKLMLLTQRRIALVFHQIETHDRTASTAVTSNIEPLQRRQLNSCIICVESELAQPRGGHSLCWIIRQNSIEGRAQGGIFNSRKPSHLD